MSLFQPSVLKKYINDLDKDKFSNAWKIFQSNFHHATKQENIRNAKEEQYQEGFLRELFVDVFGYTLNPEPDYNLTTEYKNERNSRKADGAILKDGGVRAVIELKGTDTTDLTKIETQAFGYLHNQKGCTYVVTSNFEKLRFYIQDATEHIEFNLFKLSPTDFAVLYLCLEKEQLLANVPLQIKQQSVAEEDVITKKLYADYSSFKKALYQNLVALNTRYDKLELFKKTQKLLDRFLFILFAEDRLLLPPNFIIRITNEWKQFIKLRGRQTLYERFRLYFNDLLNGNKDEDIFAYNGGLFEPDEVLDNLQIDDDVLLNGVLKLSAYDYNSEVDVNILGHIFEHSLNELEELQATIENAAIDKTKTRRKKEGVFYTPRYITKYIVENTVGALCEEKKSEIGIVEEDYAPDKRKRDKKALLQKLDDYRNWLLQLTICDPACGSGAFLNAALEFLISEHNYVDELTSNLLGYSMTLPWTPNDILEHNLFGVDINEEAVEIAKLSLWLRTAQKGRKLSNLSRNIKCGNSLIDDKTVAGDKAFNWKDEFKEVFENGGFDVVIGNPPYVDVKALRGSINQYIFKYFRTANNRINLFSVFIERSLMIIRKDGYFSFIVPSALLTQESYKELRKELLVQTSIKSIVRLPNESFGGGAGEVKVDTIIITFSLSKNNDSNIELIVYKGFDRINEINSELANSHLFVLQSNWISDSDKVFRINVNKNIQNILSKCEQETAPLVRCADFSLGITPYDKYRGHSAEQIANRVFHATYKKDETYQPLLAGNDVRRYDLHWNGDEWISYGDWLGAPREKRFFTCKRILIKQIIDWSSKRIWATLTDEELYNSQNAFNLIPKNDFLVEYLLALINSKLLTFYHKKKFLEEYKDRFQKILIKDCKEFPIKRIEKEEQLLFAKKVDVILSENKELHQIKQSLLQLLTAKYQGISISKKLSDWFSLSFKEFLKELEKQSVKLSLAEQNEWLHYFEAEKQKASELQRVIDNTDKEIDNMVYQLYGLSEEEIKLVEGK